MTKRDTTDWISDIHSTNLDVENRIIYLQEREDASSESSGVDFRMVQNFIKNINILQSQSSEPITVYLQTVGGCWYSGMGIYDAIRLSKCKVNIVGYAQICSMGTIIMQSGHKRILMPNCIFMCHYGSSDHTGDFLSSQNFAQIDKQNCQKMVDIYAEKCYKTGQYFKERKDSLSKVKAFLKRKMKDGDWYLTAEEAIEFGFADYIYSNSLKI